MNSNRPRRMQKEHRQNINNTLNEYGNDTTDVCSVQQERADQFE